MKGEEGFMDLTSFLPPSDTFAHPKGIKSFKELDSVLNQNSEKVNPRRMSKHHYRRVSESVLSFSQITNLNLKKGASEVPYSVSVKGEGIG